MDGNDFVEIKGIDEVCAALENAPKEAVPRALLAGLLDGGDVLKNAVLLRIPHGEPTKSLKPLAANLSSDVTLDAEFRGGVAEVGFTESKALWVEYGHRQIGHEPGKKDLGNVPAHPFMRPAADGAAEAAVDAFEEGAMGELEAEGLVDVA